MTRPDVTWSRLLHDAIRGGLLARLGGAAVKVWLVIKMEADHRDGVSQPSLSELQRLTGLSRQGVVNALRELEAEGVLNKQPGRYLVKERVRVDEGQIAEFDYVPAQLRTILENITAGRVNQLNIVIQQEGSGNVVINGDAQTAVFIAKGQELLRKKGSAV